MQEQEQKQKIKPPMTGVVYGEIVYWGTLLASALGLVAAIIAFLTKSNVMSPSYVISMIWKEKSPADIWNGAVGSLPNGHWYLSKLSTGDGLSTLALALGVFVVVPGMLCSAYLLYKEKKVFFATLALVSAIITVASMVGILA
jgi:hypothetical protein